MSQIRTLTKQRQCFNIAVLNNFMRTPSTSPSLSAAPKSKTRQVLAGILSLSAMAGCVDPVLDSTLINRNGRNVRVLVDQGDDGRISVSASTLVHAPIPSDAGMAPPSTPGTITNDELCRTTGVDCTRGPNERITKICFVPRPSDQVLLRDRDGAELAVNFTICQNNVHRPSWINCEPVGRPSNVWICARSDSQ